MMNKRSLSLFIVVGCLGVVFVCLLLANLQIRKAIEELGNKKDSEYAYRLKQETGALRSDFGRKNPLKLP